MFSSLILALAPSNSSQIVDFAMPRPVISKYVATELCGIPDSSAIVDPILGTVPLPHGDVLQATIIAIGNKPAKEVKRAIISYDAQHMISSITRFGEFGEIETNTTFENGKFGPTHSVGVLGDSSLVGSSEYEYETDGSLRSFRSSTASGEMRSIRATQPAPGTVELIESATINGVTTSSRHIIEYDDTKRVVNHRISSGASTEGIVLYKFNDNGITSELVRGDGKSGAMRFRVEHAAETAAITTYVVSQGQESKRCIETFVPLGSCTLRTTRNVLDNTWSAQVLDIDRNVISITSGKGDAATHSAQRTYGRDSRGNIVSRNDNVLRLPGAFVEPVGELGYRLDITYAK